MITDPALFEHMNHERLQGSLDSLPIGSLSQTINKIEAAFDSTVGLVAPVTSSTPVRISFKLAATETGSPHLYPEAQDFIQVKRALVIGLEKDESAGVVGMSVTPAEDYVINEILGTTAQLRSTRRGITINGEKIDPNNLSPEQELKHRIVVAALEDIRNADLATLSGEADLVRHKAELQAKIAAVAVAANDQSAPVLESQKPSRRRRGVILGSK